MASPSAHKMKAFFAKLLPSALWITSLILMTWVGTFWEYTSVKQMNVSTSGKRNFAFPTRRQILLVTSGRSGSSFISALIQGHQDVFYFYEPLAGLGKLYQSIEKERREERGFRWGEDRRNESLSIMESFITNCGPNNGSLLNSILDIKSNDTRDMCLCLHKTQSGADHLNCYFKMLKSCLSKPVTFAKSIRFRLAWAEDLLARYPELKVLYLVRDPRAVLPSMAKNFQNFISEGGPTVEMRAKRHCAGLETDIGAFKRLSKRFPSKLKAMRYEDVVIKPHQYAKDIYSFLGLEFTEEVQQLVTSLVTSDLPRGHPEWFIHRSNSASVVDKWRRLVDYQTVSGIDRVCSRLYPTLGYILLNQKDLMFDKLSLTHPEPGLFDV